MAPPPTTAPPTPTTPPPTPTNYELKGYVKDLLTGDPVEGATVTSGSLSMSTDVNGYFNLGTASAGTHTVNATHGWKTGSEDFNIPDFDNPAGNVIHVFAGFFTGAGGRFAGDYAYTSPDGFLSISIPGGTKLTLPGGGAAELSRSKSRPNSPRW